jgi:hypothetical protein
MSAGEIEEFYTEYRRLSDADARRIEDAFEHVMKECLRKAAAGTGPPENEA